MRTLDERLEATRNKTINKCFTGAYSNVRVSHKQPYPPVDTAHQKRNLLMGIFLVLLQIGLVMVILA